MDEKYWLEIGHLVSNIRFNAVITKSTNSKLGYRLQLKMWNSNDSKYGSKTNCCFIIKRMHFILMNENVTR